MSTRVSPTNGLTDVQATVNASSAGDIVQIPAGNVTWSGTLSVTKGITLTCTTMWSTISAYPFLSNPTDASGGAAVATKATGAPTFGQGLVIKNNGTSGGALINVTLPSVGPNFILSQIAFINGTNTGGDSTHLTVGGGSGTGAAGSPVPLVTKCWFANGVGSTLNHTVSWKMNGGVLWNNIFWGNNSGVGNINFPWDTSNPGPWTTPSTMGSADTTGLNNTYFEANTLIGWLQQAVDLDSNSRTVTRWNAFNNCGSSSHGQDSSVNGVRHWEIYNNTWLQAQSGSSPTTGDAYPLNFGIGGWLLRGGTGVLFNNSMQKYSNSSWGTKAQWLFGSFNLQEVPNAIPCQIIYPAARQPGQSWSGGSGSYGYPTPGTTTVDGTGYITDPIYLWNNQYPTIGNSGGTLVTVATDDQSAGQQPDCNPIRSFAGTDANGVAWWSGATASGQTPVFNGRDYNDNSSVTGTAGAKPGYTSYTYPHPLTNLGPSLPNGSYSTNFPTVENPISEGSVWVNGLKDGLVFHDCRVTSAGMVCGTMLGNESGNAAFADSVAILLGTWGTEQSAQGTINVLSAPNQQSEVEIFLRGTITPNSVSGYEINCSVSSAGGYLQIVRWNGPVNSYVLLDSRGTTQATTGCILKASIATSGLNAIITATLLNASGGTILSYSATDSNANNGGQGNAFVSGAPGIGFYLHNQTGVSQNYGFSSFSASSSGGSGGGGTVQKLSTTLQAGLFAASLGAAKAIRKVTSSLR